MRDFAVQLFSGTIRKLLAFSGVISLGGAVTISAVGHSILLPTWLWWSVAVLSFAAIAIQAEWKLYKNNIQQPDMRLDIVLKHIIGSDELRSQENFRKVIDALLIIREKSHLGLLSVWGRRIVKNECKNIRTPIPSEYLDCFIIKYVEYGRLSEYIDSAIGETSRERGDISPEDTYFTRGYNLPRYLFLQSPG